MVRVVNKLLDWIERQKSRLVERAREPAQVTIAGRAVRPVADRHDGRVRAAPTLFELLVPHGELGTQS